MLDKLEINSGMLVENIVAQMLVASGHRLFFYSNNSRTDASERMEIDFLIEKRQLTNAHNICPIEVKSGKNYTTVSLNKFCRKFERQLSTPYIIHYQDLKTSTVLYICQYIWCLYYNYIRWQFTEPAIIQSVFDKAIMFALSSDIQYAGANDCIGIFDDLDKKIEKDIEILFTFAPRK